jgi:copper resistance protein B
MKRSIRKSHFRAVGVIAATVFVCNAAFAGGKDNPFLTMGKLDQFEVRDTEGDDPQVLEGEFWAGYDLNKLWLKAEAERVDDESEELELQVMYSRAISAFWNVQVGGRKDFKPEPDRDWGVIALKGLAPYYFEVDASLFLGGAGRTGLRLEAEYELLFTQRLILTPEIEVNAYGHNDRDTGAGSGLADIEAGLRLRYEIRREFAPYLGVNWSKKYGNTADFAAAHGEDIEDTQLVLGIRAWY